MIKTKRRLKKRAIIISVIFTIIILGITVYCNVNLYNSKTEKYIKKENNVDNTILSSKLDDYDKKYSDLPENEIVTKLVSMAHEDERIDIILENYNMYPESLLGMLSRNIDMIDFLLDYPKKKETSYLGTIEEGKKGEYPLLLQYDKRWGYSNYGDSIIAISGCAPTALSMVIIGLTGNNKITPYTVAKYAEENGYYLNEVGTTWDLMTKGSKKFGIVGEKIPLSKETVYNSLEHGHPIICSMRPGDFTTEGHFIVLTDIIDGKIKVNDSNSKIRSSTLWDYSTLEYQIKALWSYSIVK